MKTPAIEEFKITMRDLIDEARDRGVSAKDIFNLTGEYYDAQSFFNKITEDTEESYKRSAFERILNNRPTDAYYKVLLGYLNSLGTMEYYEKLPPATIRRGHFGNYQMLDGRHRAAFCIILGIKYLPVKEIL